MDKVRQTIVDCADRQGRSLRDLSLAIGKNHAYLFQFVHKHKPEKLGEDARERLAVELGVDPGLLRQGIAYYPAITTPRGAANDLPVLGRANSLGELVMDETPAEYVSRPAHLLGKEGAFAVYVFDRSMAPRFEPGDLLQIDPTKPCPEGSDVLLVYEDDLAVVRRLKSANEAEVRVERFVPNSTETVPRSKIKRLSRVVGSYFR